MTLSRTRKVMLRRGWRWFRLRGLVLVVVFGCGLAGFVLGGEVSARPGVANAPFFTHLYYTLGLFVLGGMDLGVPNGGPTIARNLLWFAYFAAPSITASAVLEAMMRVVSQQTWWHWRMRRHIVVGGAGRLGMAFIQNLRSRHRRANLTLVDLHGDAASVDTAREAFAAHVIVGDISSDAVLFNLRLERARRVMLLTDDDFANLDAAAKIVDNHPELAGRIVAHVADLRLLQALAGTRLSQQIETFNTHEIAATHLVKRSLVKHFESTEPVDCVVIAGFGRFGQSLLRALEDHAAGRFDTVVVADVAADRLVRDFDDTHQEPRKYRRIVLDGDVADPDLWKRVYEATDGRKPVVIVGTGNDRANLGCALRVANQQKSAKIVARSIAHTAVAEKLSGEGTFEAFAVLDLIAESLPEKWCD
jgi:voltage-gated potassium channel Kch